MEKIKNFVDNIHNESYLAAYQNPLFAADGWVMRGGRDVQSLDGLWNFSVDQYDNCLRARWFLEQEVNEEGRRVPLDYGFDGWETVLVPGVWNLAKPEYFYYEGPAVYSRRFLYDCKELSEGDHVFLQFGAVSYEARVFLNGTFLGVHKGGSTPFSIDVTGSIKPENRLLVVADNTRRTEQVPSVNTDWFLYGGIYRSVSLMKVPSVYIKNMKIWLSSREKCEITVEADLGGSNTESVELLLEIPELGIREMVPVFNGRGRKIFTAGELKLWSPEDPKLYEVILSCGEDLVRDQVGFRTVETKGNRVLLNGKPLFLRGVCLHEETEAGGKAVTDKDIREAFDKAKAMNCNFLRLVHYPHCEEAARIADQMGLLLWEEIPVYWWIDFANPDTLADAKNQLRELMLRDQNRASVILWSVGNENPDTDARYHFMEHLADTAKSLDSTRLVTAACLVDTAHLKISDRLETHLDVIGLNEYYGWYDPDYGKLLTILETSHPEKPVLISEFGADGAAGVYEDQTVRGSETEQEEIYRNQIDMFCRTDYIGGTIPWILFDYRTPKRLGIWQRGYNIKGLVTAGREHEKLAFSVMKEFYEEVLRREQED